MMKKKIMYKGKRMMKYIVMALVWFTITGCDSKTQQGDVNVSEPITQTPITDNGGSTQPITSTPDTISLDTIPPIITLNGDNNITVYEGENYQELGAIAYDDKDGNIDVKISGEVNTKSVGTYIITYRASDRAGNEANTTREVNVKDESQALLEEGMKMYEELVTFMQDDSIPNTSNEEYATSLLAKNDILKKRSARRTRAHNLVAIAEDPDPIWHATVADRTEINAKPGGEYIIHLNKVRDDGSIISPVENEKLRLVVYIQRSKDEFDYISDVEKPSYSEWVGQGILRLHIPDNLEKGRLFVGIRPKFDDVATTAITERWSTLIVAEIWNPKKDVLFMETEEILYPKMENAKSFIFSSASKFTKKEVFDEVEKFIKIENKLYLPIVLKKINIGEGDKIAYLLGDDPYGGVVKKVIQKGDQLLVLSTLEIENVFDIMETPDGYKVKYGLMPEFIPYRYGDRIES